MFVAVVAVVDVNERDGYSEKISNLNKGGNECDANVVTKKMMTTMMTRARLEVP